MAERRLSLRRNHRTTIVAMKTALTAAQPDVVAVKIAVLEIKLHLSDLSTGAMRSFRASLTSRSQLASGSAAPRCTHNPSTFTKAFLRRLTAFSLVSFLCAICHTLCCFRCRRSQPSNAARQPSCSRRQHFYAEYLTHSLTPSSLVLSNRRQTGSYFRRPLPRPRTYK
jgi:hypothetical protein